MGPFGLMFIQDGSHGLWEASGMPPGPQNPSTTFFAGVWARALAPLGHARFGQACLGRARLGPGPLVWASFRAQLEPKAHGFKAWAHGLNAWAHGPICP